MEHSKLKYNDPINQIQGQIGARIITFYLDDVEKITEQVLKYNRKIEERDDQVRKVAFTSAQAH